MNNADLKNEEKEVEINIPEIMMAILKKIWIVIFVGILLGAGTFLYFTKTYVPVYETQVGIYMVGHNSENTSNGTAVQVATNVAKDYEQLITDSVVLDKVITDLKENYGITINAKELKKNISVKSPENTRVIWITVTGSSSEGVKNIANTVRDNAREELERITTIPSSNISDAKDGQLVDSNIVRNTVIIAFIGVLVTAFVIAMIYIFQDKISTRKDIEERLGLTVLGVIPNYTKHKKDFGYGEYVMYGKK